MTNSIYCFRDSKLS